MKNKKVATLALIAVLIVSVIIFLIIRGNSGDVKEIVISGEIYEECIVEKYKDGFVTFNGKEVIYYDIDMEQQWVTAVSEKDAKLCVNGEYILLYTDSDKIYLIKEGKIVYNIKSNKDLSAAQLNENGYAILLTRDKGYKGQCGVLNNSGKVIAEYSYGKKYILGAYLMPDNNTLVMNVLENTAECTGRIEFFELGTKEPVKEITSENMYEYVYVYKDNVFASDGSALYCYNKKAEEKWKYTYENEDILNVIYSDKYVSLVLKSDLVAIGNKIVTLNLKGRTKGIYESDGDVKIFDASDGYTALCINGEVVLVNPKGQPEATVSAEVKTRKILLFDKGKRVLTVTDKAVMKRFSK